jgi:hypothetical protein
MARGVQLIELAALSPRMDNKTAAGELGTSPYNGVEFAITTSSVWACGSGAADGIGHAGRLLLGD